MIKFRDTMRRASPPAWLVGATGLVQRDSRDGMLWACCEPYMLDDYGTWRDLGDGIHMSGSSDADDASRYRRRVAWADSVDAYDMRGIAWAMPRILDANGERVFRVSYGEDYTPSLTPEQYRALDLAKTVRDALYAAQSGAQDVDMSLACRWVAGLLCVCYHLTPDIIAKLAILDDVLVISGIEVTASLSCAKVDP